MNDWTCPHCNAANHPRVRTCEDCGRERSTLTHDSTPRFCPLDGTRLRADGLCPTGDGFPLPLAHPPDTCPHCHAFLRWDGDCLHCVPPGAKPGHRYDYEPYKPGVPTSAHWRITERGPQPITPPTAEQKAAISAAFNRIAPRL